MSKEETIYIYKKPKEKNQNLYEDIINTNYLTFEETGFLLYLLSKPKNFRLTQKIIYKERNSFCKTVADREIKRVLKNLKIFGYVKIIQKTNDFGIYWRTQVTNIPYDPELFTKKEIEELKKQREKLIAKRIAENKTKNEENNDNENDED